MLTSVILLLNNVAPLDQFIVIQVYRILLILQKFCDMSYSGHWENSIRLKKCLTNKLGRLGALTSFLHSVSSKLSNESDTISSVSTNLQEFLHHTFNTKLAKTSVHIMVAIVRYWKIV